MKNKNLYLLLMGLTIPALTFLIFINDLKKPTAVQAQSCVQLGSGTCRWLNNSNTTETNASGPLRLTFRCATGEYMRSLSYDAGKTIDETDVQVECCQFIAN